MRLFSILLVLLVSSIGSAQTYEQDFVRAQEEGKIWVIVISTESCPPCRALQERLKTIPNLIVTKLHPSHWAAKAFINRYNAEGVMPYRGTPDWSIYKFKEKKFIRLKRFIGLKSREQIINVIK